MSPCCHASPTTVDRKLFVTLKVMSTRVVSPHSATTKPRRMTTPFGPPRGWVGPRMRKNGSRIPKVNSRSRARSLVDGFSFAIA